jgi:hypothetical protein
VISIESKSAARFARDVSIRVEGGDISSFVVPSDASVESVTEEISSTLEQFLRGPRVTHVLVATAKVLLDQLADPNTVLVAGIRGWSAPEWQQLDLHRARLSGRALVMVMSETSASLMVTEAPHLYSFVAEPVREGPDEALLNDEERHARIATLEASKGFSSSELIARAGGGESLTDPEYGEWLLLLGREDLL